MAFGALGDFSDARERSFALWADIAERCVLAAGEHHSVGLRSDGTVAAAGMNFEGQCSVGDWTDIIAVSAGNMHTVGLRSDGTVVAVGNDHYGQCEVDGWTDIVAIAAGGTQTLGLRSDGTVAARGADYV